MRTTAKTYLRQLQALMPQGRAWPIEDSAALSQLLGGFSDTLSRNHNRAADLIDEADPRTTVELIADWERVCRLPDGCSVLSGATLGERRAAVVAKITARGGQSRAFFVGLAAALGYAISIDEHRPFTCESACDDPLNDDPWRHAWTVKAPATTVRDFTCDSPCNEPLAVWGNAALECAINSLKPAHTHAIFGYGG